MKRWKRGEGWGWVWGDRDEVGALNEMSDDSRLSALRVVKRGRVFDLGVLYDRASWQWAGHSPGEVMMFRSPEGLKRQRDLDFVADGNELGLAWQTTALFLNDNVGTQIDGLGHCTAGHDNHWYNGFRSEDWGGNWGPRRCDATTIPPIIARGVLIDMAAHHGCDALPSHHAITVDQLQAALARQRTESHPGDVVFVRTGTLRYWGENGTDHAKLREHDSAGLTLAAARWLVAERGAMMLGSDTSSLELVPRAEDAEKYRREFGCFAPCHHYLLVQQGVHIGEFHFLEELARERAYEFCYICCTNKVRGATTGFVLRPIAIV